MVQILIRRDTTANWLTIDPVLGDGEFAIERLMDGTTKLKIGDGTTNWNNLEYFTGEIDLNSLLDTSDTPQTKNGNLTVNGILNGATLQQNGVRVPSMARSGNTLEITF